MPIDLGEGTFLLLLCDLTSGAPWLSHKCPIKDLGYPAHYWSSVNRPPHYPHKLPRGDLRLS